MSSIMRILSAALVAAALASSACKTHPRCDASHAQPTVVVRVDDNSDYMKQAAANAVAPVHSMIDNWQAEGGSAVTDIALTAPDRAALEHFVATLPPPAPDHAIDYGRVASGDWRTYYVDSTPLLGNADFATGEPADRGVMLTLTKDGAKRFEAASTAAVGHKLAFVVGDRVESAPVIAMPIRGGAIQITEGPHDDAKPLLDRLGCR
jgi:preprotein translocase subunit SecD